MSDPQLSAHDLAIVDAVARRVLELLAEREAQAVDAVAQRVLDQLAEREAPAARLRLVSAGELAEILGVSRDTVYSRAEELGAVRVGADDGPRSEQGGVDKDGRRRGGRRLRFDVAKAIAAWTARQAGEESQTPDQPARTGRSRNRPGGALGSDVPLLPIGGRNGAR